MAQQKFEVLCKGCGTDVTQAQATKRRCSRCNRHTCFACRAGEQWISPGHEHFGGSLCSECAGEPRTWFEKIQRDVLYQRALREPNVFVTDPGPAREPKTPPRGSCGPQSVSGVTPEEGKTP